MKILIANYYQGNARFKIEGFEDHAFIVPMENMTSKNEVLATLRNVVASFKVITPKERFKEFDIESLEGTEL